MVPMFFIFRTRLYVAWIMSECIAIASALGAYPAASQPRCGSGPTNFEALERWWDFFDRYVLNIVFNYFLVRTPWPWSSFFIYDTLILTILHYITLLCLVTMLQVSSFNLVLDLTFFTLYQTLFKCLVYAYMWLCIGLVARYKQFHIKAEALSNSELQCGGSCSVVFWNLTFYHKFV